MRSAYPRIRIVEGDLDDSQLIQEEASNADLVLSTLQCTEHGNVRSLLNRFGEYKSQLECARHCQRSGVQGQIWRYR